MLKRIILSLMIFCSLSVLAVEAQLTEPTGMMVMDKYDLGDKGPVFGEYFRMLQEKYEGDTSAASAWGIYFESPTVMYRLAAVPGGLDGVLQLQKDRIASANAFTTAEQELFGTAWDGRQTTIWAALGSLNYMPEGWNYETVSGNPFHSTRIYYVKQGEQVNFERAIEKMNQLNRSVGVDNLMLRVFRGGTGTMAPVYMFRSASESMEHHGQKRAANMAARESIQAEWQENNRQMTAMSRHIDQFWNYRVDDLSRAPANR
tara:strand:- start:44902 stop:45681 length:780 start_codon:yes stop_codon:yes gene_type:complete